MTDLETELVTSLEETLEATKYIMNLWVRGRTPGDVTPQPFDGFGKRAQEVLKKAWEGSI
jgi:hypothetical protein